MKTDWYNELNEVLMNLYEEKTILQSQIDENNLHIQETQSLNKKIQESEEDDFRIFSPRKNRDLYRDELEQSNLEKKDYELQNSELVKKIEKLDTIINILQNVLEEGKIEKKQIEFSSNNFIADSDLYNNLEHILHKIELSIKFMRQDPDRAKMELSSVSETLQRILQHNTEE